MSAEYYAEELAPVDSVITSDDFLPLRRVLLFQQRSSCLFARTSCSSAALFRTSGSANQLPWLGTYGAKESLSTFVDILGSTVSAIMATRFVRLALGWAPWGPAPRIKIC